MSCRNKGRFDVLFTYLKLNEFLYRKAFVQQVFNDQWNLPSGTFVANEKNLIQALCQAYQVFIFAPLLRLFHYLHRIRHLQDGVKRLSS